MTALDIHQILKFLPHRYPILLVDRVLELEPNKRILALKNVSINEPYFCGHFPDHPVMPGVLILEALAQAAAVLSFKSLDPAPEEGSIYYFVAIDKARFKKPVMPGDQLRLHVDLTRSTRGFWKFDAKAEVDGEVVAEAELMCTMRQAGE